MKEKICNKKVLSILICILFAVVLGVNAGLMGEKASADENVSDRNEMSNAGKKQEESGSENSFTEEGTTSMGTISQMPEIALNRVLMYVEEVYAEAGMTVQEGDALFKIAEECIEDAKAYYKSAIISAEDSLTEAKLAYESGELEASYLKEETLRNAENAEVELETALEELDSQLLEKYQTWQETAEKIAAYNDNFYNNIYYVNSGIMEKDAAVVTAQSAYDTALAAAVRRARRDGRGIRTRRGRGVRRGRSCIRQCRVRRSYRR